MLRRGRRACRGREEAGQAQKLGAGEAAGGQRPKAKVQG